MKWRIIAALCLCATGIGFLVAFYVAGQRMLVPGQRVDLNQITWMLLVGCLCIGAGTSMFLQMALRILGSFFK